MFIALLAGSGGRRKDREPGGFAAKAEVRPWREEGGEKRGFGRKCSRVCSGRRSPGRAARERVAVPGGSGRPAPQLLPRQLPHLVPGGGGPGGNRPPAVPAGGCGIQPPAQLLPCRRGWGPARPAQPEGEGLEGAREPRACARPRSSLTKKLFYTRVTAYSRIKPWFRAAGLRAAVIPVALSTGGV